MAPIFYFKIGAKSWLTNEPITLDQHQTTKIKKGFNWTGLNQIKVMPLILLVGIPCSGKSFLSFKLLDYFRSKNVNSLVISDRDLIANVNEIYKGIDCI